ILKLLLFLFGSHHFNTYKRLHRRKISKRSFRQPAFFLGGGQCVQRGAGAKCFPCGETAPPAAARFCAKRRRFCPRPPLQEFRQSRAVLRRRRRGPKRKENFTKASNNVGYSLQVCALKAKRMILGKFQINTSQE
ncbi:MAG: hypothetical protein ACI4GA_04710, partial [Acutalibacteraceae bacterium]